MQYSLRKANDGDVGFLLDLREITMGKYLREAGMPVTREVYINRIRYDFEHARIILVNGVSAGLIKAKFKKEENEWYLVQIQIHPNFQNQSIASRLITNLIDKAKSTNAVVGLSVLKTNPAKDLYARLGFIEVGETDFEYLMQYE